ncbi:MAG: hypothetical protein V9F46_04950 [Chitinophagaceae bacterium]
MHNITLVSTIHSERGKCNSNEFFQIITSINPDVIFEEVCPELFDRFYKKYDIPIEIEPLEIKAVKRYLQGHDIKHFPVDIEPDPNRTMRDIEYMFHSFKKYAVYKKLEDEQCRMTESGGFSFLNSKRFTQILEEKKMIELRLLEFIMNRTKLSNIYKLFYEEQDNRENKWLQNIYDYSKEHSYDTAIFYCGASHRESIMQKIHKYEKEGNFKLNWTFYE